MGRRLKPARARVYVREHTLLVAVVMTAAAVAVVGLSPRLERSTWAAVKTVSAATAKATSAYWTAHRLSTATPLTVSSTSSTRDAPSQPLDALVYQGTATVGALFFADGSGLTTHYCSASVVHSRTRNLVITAAHCVYDASSGGYRYDIAFVPGYHSGEAPFGVWVPTRIVVDPAWTASEDPDHDVGFLVVSRGGSAQSIEDVTGANTLGVGVGFHNLVEVVGYPGDIDAPVRCWNYTAELSPTQVSWACGGYPDGTSGGPFLTDVDGRTGTGVIVGVIGGYEQGGDTPDVSYSTYFGPDVAELYQQAVSEA